MGNFEQPPVIPGTFQELYDPNKHLMGSFALFGRQRLMSHLLNKRSSPIELPSPDGLRPFAGRELIATELAHAMLINSGDVTQAHYLQLSDNRLEEAIQAAHFGAQEVVDGVHAVAQALLAGNRDLAELTKERDPQQLLVHGVALAALAHRGELRMSGWPYLYHPIDCAVISGIAARKEGEVVEDEGLYVLRLKQFVDTQHDTWENSIASKGKRRGQSFLMPLEGCVVSTPLVQYKLLRSRGVSEAHSFTAARANYVLTKTVGPERKGRMKYKDPYVTRLLAGERLPDGRIHLETPLAVTTKMVDLRHNGVIDPKRVPPVDIHHAIRLWQIRATKNRQNDYANVLRTAERLIAESDADPMLKRIGRNTGKVTWQDLDDVRDSGRILDELRDNNLILDIWDQIRQ